VTAFVVLAGDRGDAGVAVRFRRGEQRRDARIVFRQSGGDSLQHPRARQIESVEVRELRIARIGDDCGREGHLRHEAGEPFRELVRRQHATHHVRFGETRREEVFARWLVRERAIAIVRVERTRAIANELRELRAAGAGIENQSQGEGGLAVFSGANGIREFRQPGVQAIDRRVL